MRGPEPGQREADEKASPLGSGMTFGRSSAASSRAASRSRGAIVADGVLLAGDETRPPVAAS